MLHIFNGTSAIPVDAVTLQPLHSAARAAGTCLNGLTPLGFASGGQMGSSLGRWLPGESK